jgi:hypothetical protein
MLIESGKGNGALAGVDSDNRLLTAAFNIPFPHLIAKDYQKTFVVKGTSSTITTGADYSVLYLGNNTEDKVFVINRGILQAIVTGPTFPSAGEYFKLEMDSDYSAGGTVVTPVNLSSGSSVTSGATCYESSFTLTGSPVVADVLYPQANGVMMDFQMEGGLILLPGKSMSIAFTSGAGTAGFAKASVYFSVVSLDGYSG